MNIDNQIIPTLPYLFEYPEKAQIFIFTLIPYNNLIQKRMTIKKAVSAFFK